MKLAVFRINQLGDNVVFLPVIQALRRKQPDWELFMMTSPLAEPLFAADVQQGRIFTMTTRDFNGAWKHPIRLLNLMTRLRHEKADASLLTSDQSNVAHLLARLAGGRTRVGVSPAFIKVPGSVTDPVALPEALRVAQANWEIGRSLMQRFGNSDWEESPPPPNLGHLAGATLPIPGRIVIHPGASRAYQRWPIQRFQTLAENLSHTFEVVWIDDPGTTRLELPASVERVATDSIGALTRAIATASLFIGNNSGPMHLASALGRPSVIVSGPSNPVWDPFWYPERFLLLRHPALPCLPCDTAIRAAEFCKNKASPLACMSHWSVESVEARCREWIAKCSLLVGN